MKNNSKITVPQLIEECRKLITPEIRELVDKEMLVETRLLKWMKQTKKQRS